MLRRQIAHEFRLQRSSVYFLIAIAVVSFVLMSLSPWGDRLVGGTYLRDILAALLLGLSLPCLGAIVPLMIGSLMVAEERKREVWDWRLSLPASRTRQCALKIFVACVLMIPVMLMIGFGMFGMDALISLERKGIREGLDALTQLEISFRDIAYMIPFALIPFVFMMTGAWASSLMRDPYKALFMGIPLFGAVAGGFHLGDPFLSSARSPAIWNLAVWTSLAALALMVRWNFRFEGFRSGRFLAQILIFLVAQPIFIFSALCLRESVVSPLRGPETQTSSNSAADGGPGSAVTPLLMDTSNSGGWELYHRPDTDQLALDLGWGGENIPALILVDLTSGNPLPAYPLPNGSFRGFGKGSNYYFWKPQSRGSATYAMAAGIFPVKAEGFLARILGIDPAPKIPGYSNSGALQWAFPFSHDRWTRLKGDYFAFKLAGMEDKWQLARATPTGWEALDRFEGTRLPALSSDLRWVAEVTEWSHVGKEPPRPIRVRRLDSNEEFTIEPNNRRVSVAPWGYFAHSAISEQPPLGATPFIIPMSHDGRFLPITRTESLLAPPEIPGTAPRDTAMPIRFDLALFDTQTRREISIWRDEPAPPELKGVIRNALSVDALRRLYGTILESEDFNFTKNPVVGLGVIFPPIAWAPGRNRLAVLQNRRVHIFDQIMTEEDNRENSPLFLTRPAVDLRSFLSLDECHPYYPPKIAFIRDDLMLAWTTTEIYKIDLSGPVK